MDGELIPRFLLAVAIGSAIGFERAMRDKPAGFRTNILICLGACVFAYVSDAVTGNLVDRSRIAAQIVSGVGFLGAGAIIRDAKDVVGLTTAATIWTVAALGMACGFGKFDVALVGTGCTLLVLFGFPMMGQFVPFGRDAEDYHLTTTKTPDAIDYLKDKLDEHELELVHQSYYEKGERLAFKIRALGAADSHEAFRRFMVLSNDWRLAES